MGNFFKYAYQISIILPAVIGAVREIAYSLKSVFGSRSDLPAVSPLWPEEMEGEPHKSREVDRRGFSSLAVSLSGLLLAFFLSLLLVVSGCGSSALIPIARSVDVYAPDSAVVILDGLEVGTGTIEDLILFENYPNYLRIRSDSLDVRLILVTCPGLEGIGVR